MNSPARERIPWLAFAVAGGLALGFAFYTRHVWEDYYITYRSSRNLATGQGLVFNPGDRLHTFTSPLGVLLPALAFLLTGATSDDAALWIFRLMGAAALGGAAALVVRLIRRLDWPGVALAFAAAALCLDAKTLDFAINGMETPFLLLFLGYALWAQVAPGPRQWLHLGAAWAGLMWTRPDAFIHLGLIALGFWLFNERARSGRNRRELLGLYLRAGLLTVALYGPWLLWAWSYYGSPVPHTIVAKSAQGEGLAWPRLVHGFWRLPYLILRGDTAAEDAFLPSYHGFPSWPGWIVPFGRVLAALASVLWLGPRLRVETRAASLAFFGGVAYLSFVPYFPFPWYFPITTWLGYLALAGAAGQAWSGLEPARFRRPWRAILVAGMTLTVVAGAWLTLGAARQCRAQQRYVEHGNRRAIGEWLHAHAAPGDTVFLEPLGYIGYFSGLKTYDWPGLSSREVVEAARLVGRDWTYLVAYLQPTWLVMRVSGEGDLDRMVPFLAGAYARVIDFDRRPEISRLDVPGRALLEFDSHFVLYHLKTPLRQDADGCEIATPIGSGVQDVGGVRARLVHAPGTMVVPVPAGARTVEGRFGFPAAASEGDPRTDGAEFAIYWFDGRRRTELFTRRLQPTTAAADRGLQDYRLELPAPGSPGCRLVFQTKPLENMAKDWTFWTKPEFR